MKKKILIYSLGFVLCLTAIGGMATNYVKKESETVVTEEKKIPVRNAADTIDAGALSEEISLTENIDDTEDIEKTTEYLACYFDISLEKDGFVGGIKKICPSYAEVNGEEEAIEETTEEKVSEENNQVEKVLSGAEMVKASVVSAGKESLAQTYSDEKVTERLEFYGIHETKKKKSDTDSELKKYIACALDLGMIDEEMAQSAISGELTEEEQTELLMSVANICGKGRNYIGYSNDENIYADLRFLYGLYPAFAEEELCGAAGLALANENVQECVLKKAEYDARFLPALTICYSHESLEHMEQLIGLLNSENIVAKVQLEPKMVITKEDVEKTEEEKAESEDCEESIEEKRVESIGNRKYDLVFEFETQEDMMHFCDVVEKYAKVQVAGTEDGEQEDKEDKTEQDTEEATENEMESLIADSETEAIYMAEEAEYMLSDENTREIEKITIENDNGKLEFYCLPENTEEIKEKILELAKERELSIVEIKEDEAKTLEEKAIEEITKKAIEKITEKATAEENETEEKLEYSLKLYSKKYTCNKEFFFQLGGVDAEETEAETEEPAEE